MANIKYEEKDTVVSADINEETLVHSESMPEKGIVLNRDYAGAAAKTDPAEIRLVRKLDRRIMVYFIFLLYTIYSLKFSYMDRLLTGS